MERGSWRLGLVLCSCWQLAAVVLAQVPGNGSTNANSTGASNTTTPPVVPLDPQIVAAQGKCVGVFLTYQVMATPVEIYPIMTNKTLQPYKFQSQVSLTNTGFEAVKQWELSIEFQHDEVIAKADGVLFLSGDSPPGLIAGNETKIIGLADPDLLTSIDTAQDSDLISANFTLVGTEFGVNESSVPLPKNISMVNPGYDCGPISTNLTTSRQWVCCNENRTAINSTGVQDSVYLPRETGDITMTYDIVGAYDGNYWAQVDISMDYHLGRIDHWNLTWDWLQGEFIQEMKGAQILGPNEQDKCVFGAAARQYDGSISFENVMSCSPNPVIVDLTPDRKDDPTVGIPHCCRNGTLLPDLIDPAQSKSSFQVHVRKLVPHMAQDDISPPVNWNIGDGYKCGQPRLVSPTEFDPDALHSSSAVASWQIVCNITTPEERKCCVSFSAFFNDSVIPCPACSCGGCSSNTLPWNGQTCDANGAMLLPYNGVLVPPSNRTALGKALAIKDHFQFPNVVPCPDNCGVAINWHVYSDYRDGWSARISLFNWEDTDIPDWFAAIQMPVAMPGFQNVYSFNGSKVPNMNNTLFMDGHNGYNNNYLLKKDPEDNPGKLQSMLSFDKRKTPGINVIAGDGYPTRVWFNGDECRLPVMIPTGAGQRVLPTFQLALVLLAVMWLLGGESVNFL